MSSAPAALRIVLDWGTSSFRAFLISEEGRIVDRIESGQGIQSVPGGDFASVLAAAIGPWRAAHGPLPIYAAGMIGSRNGWVELPYAPCPATSDDLAAQTRSLTLDQGDRIVFIPGLKDPSAHPFPDVMRGEETQLIGLGLDRDAVVVLPGTHSKWARIESGRIKRFRTFVTGEIFGTLSRHSFLSKVAVAPAAPDEAAFTKGAQLALSDDPAAGGLLTRLFALRTGYLAGELPPESLTDYLSGLIIGAEFREAMLAGWCAAGDTVTVVGDDDLVALYMRCAKLAGLAPVQGPADAAVRGTLAIARQVEARGAPAPT